MIDPDWIAFSERRPEIGRMVDLSWIGDWSPISYTCIKPWSKWYERFIETKIKPTHWRPASSPSLEPTP